MAPQPEVVEQEDVVAVVVMVVKPRVEVGMEALEATVREQQLRLDSLEQQLFQSLSKQHRTGFKPVDMSPLAKLDATVRLLNDDFQRFRGTDTRQLTETICTTFQANLRKDLDTLLATKASAEELAKFDTDVKRIEAFSREVQTGYHFLKGKLETTDRDLTERFSEGRWQAMRDKLKAVAREDLEAEIRDFKLGLLAKESTIQDQLKGLQTLATTLDRDVRSQYGPEVLERHLKTLEASLLASHRSWQADQEASTQAKLRAIEEQSQVTKSLVLDAVALVKQELSASSLQQRYNAFEDRLQDQNASANALQSKLQGLEAQLQKQISAGQERQSDLFEQVQAVKDQLKPLSATIQQAKAQLQDQLQVWLKDRQIWLQDSVQTTNESLSTLQDRTLFLQDQLVLALEARKTYEEQWRQEQTTFQKRAEDQITAWTTEKADYVTTRIAELSMAFKATQKLTEEQQARITDLLSEDSLQSFVKAGEAKILQVQEEWGKRRTMEFTLKFGEFEKVLQALKAQLQDDREASLKDLSTLQADLKRTQTTEFAKQLADFSKHTQTIAKDLQRDVKAGIADIERIHAESLALQKAYTEQTSLAITQERYADFQKQTEDKLRTWFSERGTAMFQKFQEFSKDARAIHQQTKDLQTQVTQQFSDQTLQAFFKEVESRVVQSNESWKDRTTTSLQGRMDTATEFLNTSKEELDLALKGSKAEFTALEQELKAFQNALKDSVKVWLAQQQVGLQESKASMKAQEEELKASELALKESFKTWLIQQQAGLQESKSSMKAQEEELKASTAIWLADQKTALDTYVKTTVAKLGDDFTAGIQRLDGAKETIQKLHTTLREQINEAVTREKYLEFQQGLQTQLDKWTATHSGELQALLKARDTQIQQSLEATGKQVALWQKLLSEERLRGFIETIEKQLKTQQADWIQRRTLDYTQRYESFQTLGETYKAQVDKASQQLQLTEQALKDRFTKQEQTLQKQQGIWLQEREGQLSALVAQYMASLETYEKRIASKEQVYEDQVSSFKKQIQVSLQTRFQDIQAKADANEAQIQRTFSTFETSMTERLGASIQATEQRRATLLKETDGKLKATLQEWLAKQTTQLETLVEQTAQDVSAFQEGLQKEHARWIEDQTREYASTLDRSLAKIQTLFSSTILQEQARITGTLQEAEGRILTAQEDSLTLYKQSIGRQVSSLETALKQVQESYGSQFTTTLATVQELQGGVETLQKELKALGARDKPEAFQTLLVRHKTEVMALVKPRLDQLEALAQQVSVVQDSASSQQVEALQAQHAKLQTALGAIQDQVKSISTAPLQQQLERVSADVRTAELTIKSIHKRVDTTVDQVQDLKKAMEQAQQVPHAKTVEKAQLALQGYKKEVADQMEKRFTELASVLDQIKVRPASDKPLEGLQTVLARQKEEILKLVKTQLDTTQDRLREAIPSMTSLDAYHSEKLGQYEATLKKQLGSMQATVEALGGALRTELDTSLRSLETTKVGTLRELQSAVREATTVWITEKATEFARYLEDNQQKMGLLQKALLASKDEWATQKQREFTVRIGEALKQYQTALQTYTAKGELEIQERMATLEADLSRKQMANDQTVRQTIQTQLKLIQQASEKTQQDIATLYDITRTLQAGYEQKHLDKSFTETEALLARLSAPQPQPQVQPQPQNQAKGNELYSSLTKCFYTAVYAEPGQPHDTLSGMVLPSGWDAICFTNIPDLAPNGWTVVQHSPEQSSAVLNAKYIKWMSHTLLSDYDVAVWMDAYLAPSQTAARAFEKWIPTLLAQKQVLAHRAHGERRCVWDECKAVLQSKRDTAQHIEAVETRLAQMKMPKQAGLFDTNVMIKLNKFQECQAISEAVFKGLCVDTFRDQLVVTPTYTIQKFKAYAVLDLLKVFERTGTHIRQPIQ